MRDLVIYGAGGFGRETALMVKEINQHNQQFNLIGFCDDGIAKDTRVDDYTILGNHTFVNHYSKPLAVVIAVADCGARKKIKERISNAGVSFPALIHPSVLLGAKDKNQIKEGVILTAGNILTTNIVFHEFVIVNLACTIGHDVNIGAFSTLMPGCSISGNISIHEESLIGTGARILPNLSIGKKSKVGAGAVVTKSVSDGVTVVGIPAEPVNQRHPKN